MNIYVVSKFPWVGHQRATCIRQGFWPPLKPKIKIYLTRFSFECSASRITEAFICRIDLTLKVAMVADNAANID